MPRIPDIGPSVGVRTDPSGPQNISFGADAFGGNTAQALTNLGSVGQNITLDLQQKRNAVEAQNAYLAAAGELDQYLHDPKEGIYSKLGANAPGSFKNTTDKLPEIASKYTAGLNDAQRKMFNKFWAQSSSTSLSGVLRHEEAQLKNEQINTSNALAAQALNTMAMNFGSPEAVQASAKDLESAVDLTVKLKGLPKEMAEVLKREALTKGYSGVFEQYYQNEDYDGAEKVLNDHGDKMQESVVRRLRTEVKVKQQDVKIQVFRDGLIAKYGDDYEAALAAAHENHAGEEETRVINSLKTHYSDQERIQIKKDRKKYALQTEEIRASGSRAEAMAVAKRETDPEKRVRLYAVVDHYQPLVDNKPTRAEATRLEKEAREDDFNDTKLGIYYGFKQGKDKNSAYAAARKIPDSKDQLKALEYVDKLYAGIDKVELTPEQEAQRKAQTFAASTELTTLMKSRYSQNPAIPHSITDIQSDLAELGIYDIEFIKSVDQYVNRGGADKGNIMRVQKALKTMGLAKTYSAFQGGGAKVPPELVEIVDQVSASKGRPLTDKEIQDVLKDSMREVASKEKDWWGNPVKFKWYESQMRNEPQENFEALKYAGLEAPAIAAVVKWMYKTQKKGRIATSKEINDYAVSWLPAAKDQTEGNDAAAGKKFFEFGLSMVGRQRPRESNGSVVKGVITMADLNKEKFWAELATVYPGSKKNRKRGIKK